MFCSKTRESRLDCHVVRNKKESGNKNLLLLKRVRSFLLLYFIIVIYTLPSRSSFSGELRLNHSGGFLPIPLFNDLIGNHVKTIPI